MTAGMNAMLDEDTADRRYDAARDYALHGAAFDSVKSLATSIPGLSPAIKGAIDIAAPSLKLDVTGLPPNPEAIFAFLADPEFLDTAAFRSIYDSRADDPEFLESIKANGLPPGWDEKALKTVVQDLIGGPGSYFLNDYNNQLSRMNDKDYPDGAGW